MPLRTMVHAAHVTALGIWCGGLVMTGAAAAATFPILKSLKPSLPAYSTYTGDHWMLAAGAVVDRVFGINDVVQFICALAACFAMLIGPGVLGQPWRSPLFMLRACVLGAALCVLSYHLFVLTPRMQVNLKTYWLHAQAGDTAAAEQFRSAFSADHPTAQLVLASLTLLTLLGLFLGASSNPNETGTGPFIASSPELEPPALLKGAR